MLINPKQPYIRQLEYQEYEYQAELYDATVYFNDPEKGVYKHLMKATKDNQEIIMSLVGATPTHVTLPQENQIMYHNMFEGVDALYTLQADAIKEDIYINSSSSEHTFIFRCYESLPATFTEEGDMKYQDVFSLPAPYAYDALEQEVEVELSYQEGYYTYHVIPGPETIYPIVLDPTIAFASGNIFAYSKAGVANGSYSASYYIPFAEVGFKPTAFNVSVTAYASAKAGYYLYIDNVKQALINITGTQTILIPDNATAILFQTTSQSGNNSSYSYISINSIETNDNVITYRVNRTTNNAEIKLDQTTEVEKVVSLQGYYGINYSTNTPLTVQANTATRINFTYNIMPSGARDLIIVPKKVQQDGHELLNITEIVCDNGATEVLVQEAISIEETHDLLLTEITQAVDKQELVVEETIKAHNFNNLPITEKVIATAINDLIVLENVLTEANHSLSVLETIYGRENVLLTATEVIKDKAADSLKSYVNVVSQNNTSLLVSETIYDRAVQKLLITESVITGSGTVLPLLETIQAVSQDVLIAKEYIVTTNTNSLGITEYIALADTEEIRLTEEVLASHQAFINIKETLKDTGKASVYINEWVKPVSLELIETILAEQNKPVRLISFSRPVKQYRG